MRRLPRSSPCPQNAKPPTRLHSGGSFAPRSSAFQSAGLSPAPQLARTSPGTCQQHRKPARFPQVAARCCCCCKGANVQQPSSTAPLDCVQTGACPGNAGEAVRRPADFCPACQLIPRPALRKSTLGSSSWLQLSPSLHPWPCSSPYREGLSLWGTSSWKQGPSPLMRLTSEETCIGLYCKVDFLLSLLRCLDMSFIPILKSAFECFDFPV